MLHPGQGCGLVRYGAGGTDKNPGGLTPAHIPGQGCGFIPYGAGGTDKNPGGLTPAHIPGQGCGFVPYGAGGTDKNPGGLTPALALDPVECQTRSWHSTLLSANPKVGR